MRFPLVLVLACTGVFAQDTLPTDTFPLKAARDSSAPGAGYGPWKFGMSKDEIRAIAQRGPYQEVLFTDGLETANGFLDDKKRNVSFVFDHDAMSGVQIWAYSGDFPDDAIMAWKEVYAHLRKTYGVVEAPTFTIPTLSDEAQLTRSTRELVRKTPSKRLLKIQMAPRTKPDGMEVFASFIRDPDYGFYVFLFYRKD